MRLREVIACLGAHGRGRMAAAGWQRMGSCQCADDPVARLRAALRAAGFLPPLVSIGWVPLQSGYLVQDQKLPFLPWSCRMGALHCGQCGEGGKLMDKVVWRCWLTSWVTQVD